MLQLLIEKPSGPARDFPGPHDYTGFVAMLCKDHGMKPNENATVRRLHLLVFLHIYLSFSFKQALNNGQESLTQR